MEQERPDYSESGGFPEFSFVSTAEEAHSVIEEYEIRTTSRFSCYVAKKGFGETDFYDDSRKLKVMWEDYQDYSNSIDLKAWRLEFDGIPFLSLSWKKFDCHHGQDRKVPHKEKRKKMSGSEVKNRGQVTKKLGCPAKVMLREVVKFPEFKISQDTHWYRHEASRKLRSAIKAKQSLGERRIYIYLPKISDHRQHLTGAAGGITQRLDSRIKRRIQELNAEGQSNVDDIRKELILFVENELFVGSDPPPLTSRRFYPTKTDIRNHLYLARSKQEKCDTLTTGNDSSNTADAGRLVSMTKSRIRRSPRKRKLKDSLSFEPMQPEAFTDNTAVILSSQPTDVPFLDTCPEHINEVEVSSQEVVNATKSIEDYSMRQIENSTLDVTGELATPHNSGELSSNNFPSETNSVAVPDVRNTSDAQANADLYHVSPIKEESSSETRRAHTSNLEEQHNEISDSTVIDNLNLITQAMEARMLESSQGTPNLEQQLTNPISLEYVPIATDNSTNSQKQGVSAKDTKKRVGARCRSLLGQIRHMTELVEDNSVLENVQDKLLSIVSYMESHVPVAHQQTDSSGNENEQVVDGQTMNDTPDVLNIHEVQIKVVQGNIIYTPIP